MSTRFFINVVRPLLSRISLEWYHRYYFSCQRSFFSSPLSRCCTTCVSHFCLFWIYDYNQKWFSWGLCNLSFKNCRRFRDVCHWRTTTAIFLSAYFFFVTMNISGAEAVVAASSPWIGQGESACLVRPFVDLATESEFHLFMTSGASYWFHDTL